MCGCGGDGPSDGGVPGSPPGGTTGGTGLCCTCPASDDVDEHARGRYFTTTGYTVSQKSNKCSIDIQRTTSAGTVTINTSFSVAFVNVAAGDVITSNAAVTSAITSAMTNWTSGASAYKLKIEQPSCDPQELRIVFTSTFVASGADVEVTADGTATGPSSVSGGTRLSFKLLDGSAWTMTHELGHTFGLPDEYTQVTGIPIVPTPTAPGARTIDPPAASPTTTYIGAPPQADVTITQTANRPSTRHPGKYIFDNATVMGQSGNTTYPKNLFYWIAIEVKQILAAEGSPSVVTIV